MVETITPVVHGGRRGRWRAEVALHAAGAALSAALFGAVLGGLGALLGGPWSGGGVVVAAVAVLYAAREALGLPVPVPQARHQVPSWWRTFFPRPLFVFMYGIGLGIGFFTFLAHGTLIVVAAAAVVSGRPAVGAVLLGPFGLARGLSVISASRVRTARDGALLVERLSEFASTARLRFVHASVLLGVAAMAAITWRSVDLPGLASAALAIGFGWAAAAKAFRPAVWRAALSGYQLPPAVERPAVLAVPTVEGAVAVLGILDLPRAAALLALVLLSTFSVAILRVRRTSGGRLPCGCFGGRDRRDYRALLARNGALVALAVVAATRADSGREWLEAPGVADAVPAALVAATVVVGVWMLVAGLRALRGGRV